MTDQINETEKKKNNKLGLIIAFLAILVIIQGVKWYLDHQRKNELKTELANRDVELEETYNKLESVSNELQLKIEEISKLGGRCRRAEIGKRRVGSRAGSVARILRCGLGQVVQDQRQGGRV